MRQELYHWLYQMDLYREKFLNDDAINSAMLNAVSFYEMVHSNGVHLVGPVNLHEILINPENGHFEVVAGGDKDALMQDIDSIKFMPPEVLNMKSRWSLEADKFVLAEILFVLKYCKHPYDGRRVLEWPIIDVNIARQLYGDCHFVFDSENMDNSLDYYTDPGAIEVWAHDNNTEIKNAFIQVFTKGYLDAGYRLSDSDWKNLIGKRN